MKLDTPIKTEWFYTDEKEKTKINWFCFEYAIELYTFIMKSDTLRKYRTKNSADEIAAFCMHFSKQMKKSVYDRLNQVTSVVIIEEEYVADYYPKNTQRQNVALMDIAGAAWDTLLSACEMCPVRCISERERRSEFFDRYEQGGYWGAK